MVLIIPSYGLLAALWLSCSGPVFATAKMEARQVTATCIWPSQSTGTGGRTSILATANIASSPRTVTISTQTVSTHLGSRDTPTTTATLPFCTPPPAPQTHYGQCGGQGYAGATVCTSTFTCSPIAPTYYSQVIIELIFALS
ncbi:hypothetical protein SISNIDRAFT_106898 [Sistotremastrum niveocremeum HHB9708]|uniref:CBM1 domain-containing protein n=1 Tax=Sistotremastrum niveocremeum HHB9708 TaxID=1314777 RepID=A0A164TXG2_9AGAM|nr:hypothetical protein SISNIDRAFT_106898 [Sistotremastrum niveocremeum HHB9708]